MEEARKEWRAWKAELERLDKLAKDQKEARISDEKLCVRFLNRHARSQALLAALFDYRKKPWRN